MPLLLPPPPIDSLHHAGIQAVATNWSVLATEMKPKTGKQGSN